MSEIPRPQSVDYVKDMQEVLAKVELKNVHTLIDSLWAAYQKNSTIFIAGNGGSASTASHMAADISKNTVINPIDETEKRFRAVALTDNVSWMTASANDLSYEDIFVDQLRNFAKKDDLLFLISGSGNSENVVKAARWANEKGLMTLGLLAFGGGRLKEITKVNVVIPTDDYGLAESAHSFIHHYIVRILSELKIQTRK